MSDEIMKLMKDSDVEFVDLRFTDPRGKLQHVTSCSTQEGIHSWNWQQFVVAQAGSIALKTVKNWN